MQNFVHFHVLLNTEIYIERNTNVNVLYVNRNLKRNLPNGGKNEITNLITLCPNCHRMVHRNLISEEKLKKFRESWTIFSPSNEGLGALAGN